MKVNIHSEELAKPLGREHLTVDDYVARTRNLVANTRE